MEHGLEGRVAIVTGASQGLGRAIACELGARGAAVALAARREALLEEVAAELAEVGAKSLIVPTDLADPDHVRQLAVTTSESLGPVDIVVNNAAYEGAIASLVEVDDAELERSLQVNLWGVWHLARAVLPGMLERSYGRIINLMGPVPMQPAPLHTVVAASKGAVLGLTRALAAEVAAAGVTVNALCAGAIHGTEMSDRMLDGFSEVSGMPRSEVDQMMLMRTPQFRFQELEEVAAVAAFLASPAAGAITAQAVNASGGMFA